MPATLTDQGLEALLFAPAGGSKPGMRRKAEPDWAAIHQELRRPGVTLLLLWDEYRAADPDGYGYSRFCELYRSLERRLSPTMRQVHPAGERLFVDYSGQTVDVADGGTGELRPGQIFVAVLGASNYTYAEATWTQSAAGLDWLARSGCWRFSAACRGRSCPTICAPACSGRTGTSPGSTATYRDMAAHYGTAILPTRVRKPRDKAKVEVGVLVVERWILARLRNQRFFSLAELNAAIAAAGRRTSTRGRCASWASARRHLFEELDQPALSPLPAEPLRLCRVAHPARGAGLSRRHRRSLLFGAASAVARAGRGAHHRPHDRAVPQGRTRRGPSARRRARPTHDAGRTHAAGPSPPCRWTIERIGREASAIGAATAMLTTVILQSRPHPEQGFRACLGILRLVRTYGRDRVEAACARGLEIGARSYGSVQSILQHGLDRQTPALRARDDELPLLHPNIRGSRYYH